MVLAPEALAALIEAVETLIILLGWAIALGLLYVWRHTLGLAFLHLADALDVGFHVPFFGRVHIDFGGPLRDFNTLVVNFLSAYAVGSDIAVGKLWHGLAWIVQETFQETAGLARDVYHLGRWLQDVALPAAVNVAVNPVGAALHVLRSALPAIEHRVHALQAAVTHDLQRAWNRKVPHVVIPGLGALDWLIHHRKALTHLLEHPAALAPAIPRPHVAPIDVPFGRTIAQIKRRLRRVEALLGAGAFAIAMANVLGIPSARCLTRGPIGRLSRALCGLDSEALNLLLLGASEAFVVTDLCDFAYAMTKAAEAVRPALLEFVDVEEALVNCHGTDAPPALTVARQQLPTAGTPLALAA